MSVHLRKKARFCAYADSCRSSDRPQRTAQRCCRTSAACTSPVLPCSSSLRAGNYRQDMPAVTAIRPRRRTRHHGNLRSSHRIGNMPARAREARKALMVVQSVPRSTDCYVSRVQKRGPRRGSPSAFQTQHSTNPSQFEFEKVCILRKKIMFLLQCTQSLQKIVCGNVFFETHSG